jgi:hypothetical protein
MMKTSHSPRYAVLFKTYFWDAFTARQWSRLGARTHGDVFVVVDETAGPVQIDGVGEDHILRLTESEAVAYGLPAASTDSSVFWYNADYPHHIFFDRHPDYDYYFTIEYDAVADLDIDQLIADLARDEVDFLCPRFTEPPRSWPWFERHLEIYDEAEITVSFSQVAAFSPRAMRVLRQRRLDMAKDFASGALGYWPNNECFMATEIRRAGMRTAWLTDYGRATHFNWWPPMYEGDLAALRGEAFVHPVLEGARYVRSVLKNEPNFFSVFSARSALRARLAKLPPDFYRPFIAKEFKRRSMAAIKRRLAKVGLAPDWSQGAESPHTLGRARR